MNYRGVKTGRSVCETFSPVDALTQAERAKIQPRNSALYASGAVCIIAPLFGDRLSGTCSRYRSKLLPELLFGLSLARSEVKGPQREALAEAI